MAQQAPPISEGEIVAVNIESVGDKGDGVAKINGFVVFVAGAKKGQLLNVEITKVLPSVAFATVVGEAKPSDFGGKQDPLDELDYENVEESEEF